MKALKQKRKPALWEWLFSGLMVVAGVLIQLLCLLPGTTAESDLTALKGAVTDAKETTISTVTRSSTSILTCTLSGYHFEYTSDQPDYAELKQAAASGRPIEAWVSTKTERAVLREPGMVRLYKLKIGDKDLLTYDKAVSRSGGDGDNSLIIVGGVVMLLGCLALYINWQQLQNFSAR